MAGGGKRWKEVEGNGQQVLVVGKKWPRGCHKISECCKMLSGGFKMWQKVVMRLWDVEGGCHGNAMEVVMRLKDVARSCHGGGKCGRRLSGGCRIW